MNISELLAAARPLQEQLIVWRRDFHRHPELGYEEERTSAIVAAHLRSLGLEVITGVGRTGDSKPVRSQKKRCREYSICQTETGEPRSA
ncbi:MULTISPECIES: hypothetical protein [Paenibacillus]|uniref:hypothetical protein n=1 Tax=Paenibacillus TaxID=44249 RepID=UPI003009C68C